MRKHPVQVRIVVFPHTKKRRFIRTIERKFPKLNRKLPASFWVAGVREAAFFIWCASNLP